MIFSVNAGTLLMNQSIVKLEPSGSTAVALKSTLSPAVVITGETGVVTVIVGAPGTGGGTFANVVKLNGPDVVQLLNVLHDVTL